MLSAHISAMKVPVPTFILFDSLISGSPITLGYALIYLYLWKHSKYEKWVILGL